MYSYADNGIRMSFVSLSQQKLSAESLLQDTGKRDKMHSSGKLGPQKKGHTRKFILSLRHDQSATSCFSLSGSLFSQCRFATFITLYSCDIILSCQEKHTFDWQ